jgi:tryptophanyl-tRNA synthetase
VSWKYLQFFMDDDERLKQIGEEYGSGRMLTGEIKAELIKVCSATNPHVFVIIALWPL